MNKLLTVRQVADLLALSEITIRRMVARGDLPVVRVGRSVRFNPADIEALKSSANKKRGEKNGG